MNTTAAATTAGVTVATIRRWCRYGAIAARKTAGRWVIDAASLAHRIRLSAHRAADRTREFADELAMQIDGGAESLPALNALLRAARARDTQYLGGVPAAQVHLTDAQWSRIERDIRFEISCLNAEY